MALVLCPEVQCRARAEIDAIIGRERLPEHSDKASLPYIDAICREVLRWHTVTPLGVPVLSVHDDIYEGKLIPGGEQLHEDFACRQQPEAS
jgi:cytochrome P450